MPIQRARTRIVGTMEIYISSRSSWILLPASPWCNTRLMGSISTIKVSAWHNILTVPLNNFLVVRTKWWLHLSGKVTWPHRRMVNWFSKVARAVKGSNITVIMYDYRSAWYWVYYQDPELYLIESYYNHSKCQWILGEQCSWFMFIHEWAHPSHFRWIQPQCTAVEDPHNCRSRPQWQCGYKHDMERCTGMYCEW